MNKTFKLSNKGRLSPGPGYRGPPAAAALDSRRPAQVCELEVQRLCFWDGWGIPARKRLGFLWRKTIFQGCGRKSLVQGISQSVGGPCPSLHRVGTGQGIPVILRPLCGAPRAPGQCFPTHREEASG